MKNPDQMLQTGKDIMDAMAKSFAAFTSGYGEVNQHIIAHAQQSLTDGLTASKEIFELKSPGDWSEFHSKWASSFINKTAVQTAHFSKLSVQVTSQVCEPLKECISKISGVAM